MIKYKNQTMAEYMEMVQRMVRPEPKFEIYGYGSKRRQA